jgi:hypothetical protein
MCVSPLRTSVDGETDLVALVAGMTPVLRDGEYVFCSLRSLAELPPGVALGTFTEDEGTTVILRRADAERAGLRCSGPLRLITLQVGSNLAAVGFTAAVAGTLARAGIAANVVAAFHHDHVFVPAERAAEALGALRALADQVRELGGEGVGIEGRLGGEA